MRCVSGVDDDGQLLQGHLVGHRPPPAARLLRGDEIGPREHIERGVHRGDAARGSGRERGRVERAPRATQALPDAHGLEVLDRVEETGVEQGDGLPLHRGQGIRGAAVRDGLGALTSCGRAVA